MNIGVHRGIIISEGETMESIDIINMEFFNKSHRSGNEMYFPLKTTIDYTVRCSELGIAILGIDFFHIINGKIVPVNPIDSIDTDIHKQRGQLWGNVVQKCNSFVLAVLNKYSDITLYCNIVTMEESEF
jgi:hypothetical protein